ncbi:hypothetical protein ACNPJX_000034 [Vibrio parahaemolyticus]
MSVLASLWLLMARDAQSKLGTIPHHLTVTEAAVVEKASKDVSVNTENEVNRINRHPCYLM